MNGTSPSACEVELVDVLVDDIPDPGYGKWEFALRVDDGIENRGVVFPRIRDEFRIEGSLSTRECVAVAQLDVQRLDVGVEILFDLDFDFVRLRPRGVLEHGRAQLVELCVVQHEKTFRVLCLDQAF